MTKHSNSTSTASTYNTKGHAIMNTTITSTTTQDPYMLGECGECNKLVALRGSDTLQCPSCLSTDIQDARYSLTDMPLTVINTLLQLCRINDEMDSTTDLDERDGLCEAQVEVCWELLDYGIDMEQARWVNVLHPPTRSTTVYDVVSEDVAEDISIGYQADPTTIVGLDISFTYMGQPASGTVVEHDAGSTCIGVQEHGTSVWPLQVETSTITAVLDDVSVLSDFQLYVCSYAANVREEARVRDAAATVKADEVASMVERATCKYQRGVTTPSEYMDALASITASMLNGF